MVCRNSNIRKKLLIFTLFLIIFLCGFTYLVNILILDHYEEIASQEGKKISAKILTRCILEITSDNNFNAKDIIKINYGKNNEIISVETDAVKINQIQLEILDKVNSELSDTNKNCSEIPLGTLSDLPVFVGEGPEVTVKFSQQGSAKVLLESKFESGGINQTIHRIYAHIETEIYSISPVKTENIDFSFDYLLCETIIVGEIPIVYS